MKLRLPSVLRYTSRNSSPIGYGNRMLLFGMAPFVPLLLFDINPRSSIGTEIYFGLFALWLAVIGAFSVRELWNAVWVKPR
jgi:hypothetical protein